MLDTNEARDDLVQNPTYVRLRAVAQTLHFAEQRLPNGERQLRAMLRSRAREYSAAARHFLRALADGMDPTVVASGALERGLDVMTAHGPARVRRTSATGYEIQDPYGGWGWENPSSPTSPIVVVEVEQTDE